MAYTALGAGNGGIVTIVGAILQYVRGLFYIPPAPVGGCFANARRSRHSCSGQRMKKYFI